MSALDFPTFKKIPVHIWIAASAWGSRLITGLVQLFSMRILIGGLGTERYAVFVLLTSLIGWYTLADAGVGLSLMNYISEQRAKKESYARYVLMAALITLLELVAGLIILYGLGLLAAPIFLKQFGFLGQAEKIKLFYISGAILFSTSLCGLTYKIWYAEQKGYLANIVPAVASLLGLAGAWLVLRNPVTNKLYWSLLAFISPPLALGLGLFLFKIAFIGRENWHFEPAILAAIIKRAMRFFGFTLLGLVITQIDYLILSQTVKAYDIVIYNIVTKLYSFAFTIYAAVLAAWHPVNCEMYIRREFDKIKSNARLYALAGIGGMTLFIILLLVFKSYVGRIFSPNEIIVIPGLFILFTGLYFIIRIWNDTFVTLLVSMNKFRQMFMIAPVQIAISLGLQIFLARQYGIYGIAAGLFIAYVLTSAWFLPWAAFRFISGMKKE
ncbi:MAG: MATE family efflux transporter [bacterium]|nr:MATE family efflux transporter [bacterium]